MKEMSLGKQLKIIFTIGAIVMFALFYQLYRFEVKRQTHNWTYKLGEKVLMQNTTCIIVYQTFGTMEPFSINGDERYHVLIENTNRELHDIHVSKLKKK